MTNVNEFLVGIPASLPYGDWIRVAAALKNEGESFETFDRWSQTAPEKYDADMARKTWDSIGGEDHPEITGRTLSFLQRKYGKAFIPTPQKLLSKPETAEELKTQREMLLAALFSEDEVVELVVTRAGTEKTPDRPCIVDKWPAALQKLQQMPLACGAWFGLNPLNLPLKGNAPSDQDVRDYRYALLEADDGTLEEQWQAIAKLPVIPPIQAAVWSGNKSLHFIVKIEARDQQQFQDRVKAMHEYLKSHGIKADPATKNAFRLARLPGVKRGNDVQYLVAGAFGAPDWTTFAAHIEKKSQSSPDQRAVSSPVNGKKGGRPPLDTPRLAQQFLDELEKKNGKLIYWQKHFHLFRNNSWVKLEDHDLYARFSEFLQNNIAPGERIGKQTVLDLRTCLEKNYISDIDCPEQPFLIAEKQYIPDCMIFRNGAVSIDELKSKTLSASTVIPKNSNLFGEEDVAYNFDPNAQCPRWEEAVKTWFPDKADQKMLQCIFGYIISRSTNLNVCFFWYGRAGSGKSTALNVLRALMGEKRCSAVSLATLCGRFNTARLATSYLNTQEELPTGGAMRGQNSVESLLKTATDGGTVQIEHKGVDPTDGQIKARFVFCTNTLPMFSDPSEGLWDRLVILPFEQKIRFTDKQEVKYDDILCEELPGIFNWAVQGMKELQGLKSFPVSQKSAQMLADLHQRCNLEGSFVREYFAQSMGHALTLEGIMRAYDEYVATYNGIPKTRDAIKAALQMEFPFVEFKRSRILNGKQVPAVINLQWLGEDDTSTVFKLLLKKDVESDADGKDEAANTQTTLPDTESGTTSA